MTEGFDVAPARQSLLTALRGQCRKRERTFRRVITLLHAVTEIGQRIRCVYVLQSDHDRGFYSGFLRETTEIMARFLELKAGKMA